MDFDDEFTSGLQKSQQTFEHITYHTSRAKAHAVLRTTASLSTLYLQYSVPNFSIGVLQKGHIFSSPSKMRSPQD